MGNYRVLKSGRILQSLSLSQFGIIILFVIGYKIGWLDWLIIKIPIYVLIIAAIITGYLAARIEEKLR